ncbi:MAG: AtpZ/AtpI family protein [Rhodothermales bacterium]
MSPSPPSSKRPPPHTSWQASFREASPYLGLGMQLALTMAFFVVGGYLLDRWLGTTPWLVIAGAVLGMVAVFVHLFRIASELNKKSNAGPKKDSPDDREDPPEGSA